MAKEINDYIMSCPVCAQAKMTRHFPDVILMSLATPQRPWVHLAIDLLTNLPKWNTVILVFTVFKVIKTHNSV